MIRLIPLCLLIMLLGHACTEDVPSMPAAPVIEGWLDAGGHPVVMFTTTVSPGNSGGSLDDKMIQWGRVSITDGTDTVVMTAGISPDYFPPHRYYTTGITGVPGRTYTITADYRRMHATATATMPLPTPIDSVGTAPVEGNDTLRALTLHFTAPADVPAWYYVTLDLEGDSTRALPTMLGNAACNIPGELMQIPVLMPKNRLSSGNYTAYPAVGDRLVLSLHRVDYGAYQFWTDFDNLIMFGSSQFVQSAADLRSNITGGYGVWSVRGTSSVALEVH